MKINYVSLITSIVTIYAIFTNAWWINWVAYWNIAELLIALGAWGVIQIQIRK